MLGIATTLMAAEALIRARLVAPAARMPSAYYSRPTGWSTGEDVSPVWLGSVDPDLQELRVPVSLARLPHALVDAVLAVEDQRFYQHHGIDLRRIGGALIANVKAGGIEEGGSTLTQQLAKNLFLSADRTPIRKAREAAMALVLEARYSKDRILEAYLNEIYFGQDGPRAIRGVGAAARYYFGKDARRLTLDESALLAGMIRSPNRLAPTRHPDEARARRDLVLSLMLEQGRVSRGEAERARRAPVRARAHPAATVEGRWIRDYLARQSTPGAPERGEAIYTTVDADLQRSAERAIRNGLDRLRQPGAQAALIAISPRTGDLLAMVGGRDYGASQFNRATDAPRQPGSAFKPIVALAALSRGGDRVPGFTLASVVEDLPLSVRTSNGLWQPANYDGSFQGPVTVRQALEESLNVPFARIGLAVGADSIAAMARRVGIERPLAKVPSLALGSGEVTLLELTRAYGVLAAGGELAATRVLLSRRLRNGTSKPATDAVSERVVDQGTAFLVTSALQGVVEHGTGQALGSERDGLTLAGKTGTSSNWRDAWFIAYSPEIVVGVWVGYDDGRSLRLTGAAAALPIVARFLDGAGFEGGEGFEVPDDVVSASVPEDPEGGWCGRTEYFLRGTQPADEACDEPSFEFDGSRDGSLTDRLRDRLRSWLERRIAERIGEFRSRGWH